MWHLTACKISVSWSLVLVLDQKWIDFLSYLWINIAQRCAFAVCIYFKNTFAWCSWRAVKDIHFHGFSYNFSYPISFVKFKSKSNKESEYNSSFLYIINAFHMIVWKNSLIIVKTKSIETSVAPEKALFPSEKFW